MITREQMDKETWITTVYPPNGASVSRVVVGRLNMIDQVSKHVGYPVPKHNYVWKASLEGDDVSNPSFLSANCCVKGLESTCKRTSACAQRVLGKDDPGY